jgi:Na+-transporting NADH:ubiquinone oxidoreductase subunit NqrA
LLFEDKLFGFLAHSVFFDEEEIDIIALILLKNYAKVFPIEIQVSSLSGDEIEKTEDKSQKLGDLLENVEYPEGRIEVHNL